MAPRHDEKWRSQDFAELCVKLNAAWLADFVLTPARSSDEQLEQFHRVWDLYSDAPQIAEQVLPPLLVHPHSWIRAGAMRGIANLARDNRELIDGCLPCYRHAVDDEDAEVRDAAAFGLKFSTEPADEANLWRLLSDSSPDVRYAAAYALRDSLLCIDQDIYREVLDTHENEEIRLILAERSLRDERLLPIVKTALGRFIALDDERFDAHGDFGDLGRLLRRH